MRASPAQGSIEPSGMKPQGHNTGSRALSLHSGVGDQKSSKRLLPLFLTLTVLPQRVSCWRELLDEGKQVPEAALCPCSAGLGREAGVSRASASPCLSVQVVSEHRKLPSSPMCPTQPVLPQALLQPPACLSCSKEGHHSWGLS